MKKFAAILTSIILILSLLAACGDSGSGDGDGGGDAKGQTLVIHHWGDPLTMNPDTTGDDYNYIPAQNIYNRMVKLDYNMDIIPDLARSWDVSEDGKTITFHLAEGVKWHDGEPFTSADVEYTFETLAKDESLVAHSFYTDITDVSCPDDTTAVFTLANPNTALIGYMGWYGCFVMPKHIFDNGEPWADNTASSEPIGTGPFKFESFKPGASIELVKNPDYWEGAPKLDRLIFKIIPDPATAAQALRTGEIDFMEITPYNEVEALEAEGFQSALCAFPSPMYLLFNFRDDYSTPLAVRQAIALCVNREDINNKVFGGSRLPEYNFYPSLIDWASNSDAAAPQYNIEEAVNVLEAAGYTKDADGYYVRGLQIECYTDDNAPDVSKLIADACDQAGIEVKVNAQEYLAWDQTVNELSGAPGTFSIALMGGFQGPDPSALINRVGSGGASNLGKYSSAEIDSLLSESKILSDQDERKDRFYQIQQIMSEDLPIIPIVSFTEYNTYAANLKGVPKDSVGKSAGMEFTYAYFE